MLWIHAQHHCGLGRIDVQAADVVDLLHEQRASSGTPASSWINQVERFFAYLTNDLLRRSDHRSVQALETDIRNWVAAWNENPKPFIWTKTAEQILESISRLLQRINGAGH